MIARDRWEKVDLDAFRHTADPQVDRLVAALLPEDGQESLGRLGYNAMLMLADQWVETPELAEIPGSRLARQLAAMPPELIDYFRPEEAPDWIDEAKLKLGAKLWQDNTLMTLMALYGASLPACYLIKNGIPALYQTHKLGDHQYIYQRIYETGLMLADTMDADGIKIIHDSEYEDSELYLKALQNLDAEGQWVRQGHSFCRSGSEPTQALDPEHIYAEIERLRGRPRKYICGKGFIAAKKVRFLHASMRYMLLHRPACPPLGDNNNPRTLAEALRHRPQDWDTKQYGLPVNQEDLAYTLLTFGLLIPKSLARMGVPLSLEQKEAFLHLWRLIGHVMGVTPTLLTDDWEEAEALFAKIQQRQAGASHDGQLLTQALIRFLSDYMPHSHKTAERLSAFFMTSQLGREQAAMILPERLMREVLTSWRRPLFELTGWLGKKYLGIRGVLFSRFKLIGGLSVERLHQASELLILSWRDGYSRQPFFVPATATSWIKAPGVDAQFLTSLRRWRQRIFLGLAIALGLLVPGIVGTALTLPAVLIWGWPALQVPVLASAACWVTALALMQFWLPAIFKRRPQPGGVSA